MNSVTIIICGASGDLTKRKLIPALYRLIKLKKFDSFCIIGIGIEQMSVHDILERAKPYLSSYDPAVWQQLVDSFSYYALDITNQASMHELAANIAAHEQRLQLSGNRLVYVALSSHLFCSITEQLAQSGIAQRQHATTRPWHRIIYEKPFGYDLTSAHMINSRIQVYFDEHQIYRIDHYLAKEFITNITLVRFTNCLFEPLWNNQYIDHVEIVLSETNDVHGRADYYDRHGAVRDVVQNHMLELLALIAMEFPEQLVGDYIRNERVRVLQMFSFRDGVYGQYRGYQQEPGVAPDSKTETFAMLVGSIDNARWAGVPFYFKTGKALNTHETVIHITFKQVDCLLQIKCPSQANSLTIRVYPDATFSLQLNVKKPGTVHEVVPITMEFCHSCLFIDEIPLAHEVLLEEVIKGETAVSVRVDEIERSWQIIDQLKALSIPMGLYDKRSAGPDEMYNFMKKHAVRWQT